MKWHELLSAWKSYHWTCEAFIVLKATAGGGGRGMRLAKEPDEFVKLLQVLLFASYVDL